MEFEPGRSYPIDSLPDDLNDKSKLPSEVWAIRDALFWNECQGWWIQGIADYHLGPDLTARFWQPVPVDPMTREEILAERGQVVCPECDWAIDPQKPHFCQPSEAVLAVKAKKTAGLFIGVK